MKKHKNCRMTFLLLLLSGSLQLVAQTEIQLAQTFLEAHAEELGLQPGDYACLQLQNHYQSSLSQVQHYYFSQCHQGIGVHRAVLNLHYKADGELLTWGNRFVPDLASKIQGTTPVLSAAEAVEAAAEQFGYPLPDTLIVKSSEGGAAQAVVFDKGNLSVEDIPVRLKYQLTKDGSLRLAWDLSIQEHSGAHWWSLRVDAQNGEILDANDWVISCEFGEPHSAEEHHLHELREQSEELHLPVNPVMAGVYNVYPEPVESPSHGGRQLITDPDDPIASPYGWHDTNAAAGAEYTITRGNNVYAQWDNDNNNNTFGFAPDGGSGLVFDFPIDLTQAPSTYISAAITNLFYWNNHMHDFAYAYGFDEASGNFQVNNYGNGGLGSDEVIADAQDSGGSNNANFSTPVDGNRPRMQMYLWNYTSPQRDGDLDNGIIAHEYGHGISTRLTGGPANSGCLNNEEQMGEGWSDFYSLMTTMETGDMGTDSRGIGTYVLGQPPTGNGIRPTPYSTLMSVNPTTYGDIGGLAVPHGVGYAWCTMIWEVTWGLIAEHGVTDGFDITMNLITEGMKLQPCSPGFVDGRDAILAADVALYNGENACIIWTAFAKRGLGFSADQGSNDNAGDETEAFNMPPACVMDIQPPFVSICKPDNAVYTITVGANNGNVTLTPLSGVPPGATVNFSVNPVPSPGSSTMTISNLASVTPDTYLMSIEGAGSDTTVTVQARLKVHEIGPAVPSLSSPANNATGIILSPTLTWSADVGADSFTVQVASDAAFTTIVASSVRSSNSYQVQPQLTSLTQYWWRVKAENACGETAYSAVSTFTTAFVICVTRSSPNVPITIPSNAPATVNSLLNMPIQGTIQDVNVKTLNITHTWIDDLVISVKSPANTSAIVMNRPCDSENNILTNLDDEASSATYPCPPTNSGTYIPYAPLSAYDNQSPLGPWTLTVQDLYAQDGGSIVGWGLEVCYIPAATCGSTFYDSGGPSANYQNNENITWTLCGDLPGQIVTVDFNTFSIQNNFDFLKVYDGANASAPLIATYTGTTVPAPVTATSASGCLTFVFTSNGSTNSSGWNADVTCCTSTPEICNMADDDCDGQIDEGVILTFYQDSDSDTYGNLDSTSTGCTAPAGYVSDSTDCDDANSAIHPGAAETCNLVDDDCDLAIDEGAQLTFFQDSDGDMFGNLLATTLACTAPAGYVSDNTDCDDANSAIHPGAAETCNLVDDDCDLAIDEGVQLTFFQDSDGDMFGNLLATTLACAAPAGYVSDNTDCNDTNAAIYPGAAETCNLVDDDCDLAIDEGVQLTFFQDSESDNYGNPSATTLGCAAPAGYVSDNTDCDDTNAAIHPGAVETCNLVDDDCDLAIDEGVQLTFFQDSESDNYGNSSATTLACTAPAGYVSDNTDCDDTNAAIHPGATEICNNLDDDCSGAPEAVSNTWTGAGDGVNWSDASNWSDGIVPLTCQDVVVPAGFNVVVPVGFEAVGRTLDVPVSGQIEVLGTMVIQN